MARCIGGGFIWIGNYFILFCCWAKVLSIFPLKGTMMYYKPLKERGDTIMSKHHHHRDHCRERMEPCREHRHERPMMPCRGQMYIAYPISSMPDPCGMTPSEPEFPMMPGCGMGMYPRR